MHKADLFHSNKELQRKLEQIFQLRRTKTRVNWDQEKYLDLLQHFGNPHKRLPLVVHVAGTNGKGSIIAMLRGICEAAGMRVHCYTSPHLVHVNERIVLAGQEIGDDRLEALIDEVLDYVGDAPLSFFEVISAVAFKAFSEVPADILLLEVGMGGRLDCTNVIEKPLVSVIGRISMDHTQFLGDTIEEIAAQKAGIIKHGVPCILGYQGHGEQGRAVLEVVQQKSQKEDAPLFLFGQDYSVIQGTNDEEHICFSYLDSSCDFSMPVLSGVHQIHNAAAALAAVWQMREQGMTIPDTAVSAGLKACQWPGRLQRVDGQWPEDIGAHEIWLDCGHNDSAGEALAEQIMLWNDDEARPTYLIVGMLGAKDSGAFLGPLLEVVSGLYVVPISSDPSAQSFEQIRNVCGARVEIRAQSGFADAVREITEMAPDTARILIAGSVYLAGEVLQFINNCESR